ncbi:pre-mRNA-splicing factor rse1 [Byssothecium circinans]|uniref:Pre-mRNA-splicing factor rse1 n=1 Tax=Byssothecium circinans TaxID=147558 RepID=A0A6A5TJ01_9PLEO|nr:pre-mRNA-splicing factor rse1 [Byssothecium circinans]
MTSFSTLSLYSLTVKQPTATQDAVAGDFIGSGKGEQQVLTANGSRLTLLQVARRQQGFREIYSQDVFGIIRRIAKFRLAGATKDHIVITTDSGRLVTYEYLPDEQQFKTVHFETFGKSGIRRVVPGEYLAVDPKGRAIMIASTEKNKLVYILTRSGQTDIAISSPLEAHKPQTLMYSLVGLDVGYDNPMFAALELDFSNAETDPTGEAVGELKKELVFYELDLGLNHIVRKYSEEVDRTANILFRAPGGPSAPSGVLVCGEDSITYHRIYNKKSEVHRLPIPRREGATEDPNRKRTIVTGTLYMLKGGDFFYLLQTDDGDVFKLKILPIGSAAVEQITIKYFDTIPIATSICILRAGFVYAACESGDRVLYELESLGDETDDPLYESGQFPKDPNEPFDIPFFKPRALTNLTPVEHLSSLNPIMDMEVANLALEDAPQVYTINGAGGRGSFRTTRNALEVLDLIESPLPQEASSVWTTKLTSEDETDTLIILCLHSRTLVLKIGDDVEEASNTGFLLETNTLGVQQFGEDCILQIHPKGIRHIQRIEFENEDATATHASLTDWQPPAHRTIVACASNNRQVAIALSSGQILYFECDSDGSLAMAEEEIALDATINCLAIPDVPEGSVRAFFMAVGCSDNTVRIYNLSPDMEGNILRSISVQGTSSTPTDLTINSMTDKSPRGYSQFLHIGLLSGVYIRSVLDEMTGEIGNTRRRFLGPEPVTFTRVMAAGEPAVLAMTSRPWLAYTHPRTSVLQLTPLNYIPFKSAWNFEGSAFKGIICVSATELRIFTFNDLHDNTTFEQIPLKYTPRKFIGYHDQGTFFVIESEANTMGAGVRQKLIDQGDDAMDVEKTNGETSNGRADGNELPPTEFGYPKAQGRWASCIQIVDPVTEKAVVHTVELTDNKSAVSVALVTFEGQSDKERCLAVGTAKNLQFTPYKFTSASIQLYKVSPDGRELEFMHETEVSEPPLGLTAFKGKLVVGTGRDLALYDCGMRSVLRKAMTHNCVPTRIVGLKTQGSRIIVSDQTESVTYVVHKDAVHPNLLIPFADDTVARHTSSAEMLDYETTVGGDKFGNIWLVRCPPKVSEASDESPEGLNLIQDKSYLAGAPNRLDLIAHYFVNDIPTSIQRTVLLSGGEKVIFWAGLQGTLGALIPFSSRRQHKMFQQLELLLRNEDKPLSGRDHLAFRSYYTPVKSVIDGDLIERFLVLSRDKRESIVGQLTGAWSSEAVDESIWNMRGLYVF